MKYLLTGREMAEADRATSEVIGIPSIVLMERAALAVANEITARFPGMYLTDRFSPGYDDLPLSLQSGLVCD